MGANWHTSTLCFHKLRELIAEQIDAETPELLAGEIKEDESYFGGAEQQSAAAQEIARPTTIVSMDAK